MLKVYFFIFLVFRRPNVSGKYVQGAMQTSAGRSISTLPNPSQQPLQSNMNYHHFNPPPASAPASSVLPPPPSVNSHTLASEPTEMLKGHNTPAAFDPSIPRGWNDPPLLAASRKVINKYFLKF